MENEKRKKKSRRVAFHNTGSELKRARMITCIEQGCVFSLGPTAAWAAGSFQPGCVWKQHETKQSLLGWGGVGWEGLADCSPPAWLLWVHSQALAQRAAHFVCHYRPPQLPKTVSWPPFYFERRLTTCYSRSYITGLGMLAWRAHGA